MVRRVEKTLYGFVDESGAPGASNDDNDYFVVSVILLEDKECVSRIKTEFAILRKRMRLNDGYEFHSSHNNNDIREAVINAMRDWDFTFMTFAIRKDKTKKSASYANIAEMLIKGISEFIDMDTMKAEIIIDTNPSLVKALTRIKKKNEIKRIYFSERQSHRDDGIQLADYVVNIHSKVLRGNNKAMNEFEKIKGKMLGVVIAE